jgi:DNA-binding transcriptional ArsR family regulator
VKYSKPKDIEQVARLYRALGNPLRLQILLRLITEPACVHDLSAATSASQPLVSQHLRVLRGERLVTSHRSGKEVVYQLADTHIAHILNDAIAHIQEEKHDDTHSS